MELPKNLNEPKPAPDLKIPLELSCLLEMDNPAMNQIIDSLLLSDLIYFAASNTTARDYVLGRPRMKSLTEQKSFNLDIFPSFIGPTEITSVRKILPNTEKITINLYFAHNHLLDNLAYFKKLRKLTIYLSEDSLNSNIRRFKIESLTIRATFRDGLIDSLYALMKQLIGLKRFALYGGFLSLNTINYIELLRLNELKLDKIRIKGNKHLYLIKIISENKFLKKLSITSSNFANYPCPIIIISDLIAQLPSIKPLKIETLRLTLDQHCRVKYENLKLLKNLKNLKILYNVQEDVSFVRNALNDVSQLKNVNITFQEYLLETIYRDLDTFANHLDPRVTK